MSVLGMLIPNVLSIQSLRLSTHWSKLADISVATCPTAGISTNRSRKKNTTPLR